MNAALLVLTAALAEPGFVERHGLVLGATALFFAIAGLAWFSGIGRRRASPTLVAPGESVRRLGRSGTTALRSLAEQATLIAERSLEKRERTRRVTLFLERAGMNVRPGELIVIVGAITLAGFAAGLALGGVVVGGIAAATTLLAAQIYMSHRGARRKAAFAERLPDALQLMADSLRAGFGFMQAVDTVGSEVEGPVGAEFRRAKVEVQLGRDLTEAFHGIADRVDSDDFRWVVDAIQIHREIGGDLADILDAVTETIRDRNRVRRRISALSAEGRVSALVLTIIPFALALVIQLLSPGYLGELTHTGIGQVLIVIGLAAMVSGYFWMRNVTRLEY